MSRAPIALRAEDFQDPDDAARRAAEAADGAIAADLQDGLTALRKDTDDAALAAAVIGAVNTTIWRLLRLDLLTEAAKRAIARLSGLHDQVAAQEMAAINDAAGELSAAAAQAQPAATVQTAAASAQPAIVPAPPIGGGPAGAFSTGPRPVPIPELGPLFPLGTPRPPGVIPLAYDPLDAATVAAQQDHAAAIADTLERTAQRTADQVVADGIRSGRSVEQIARDLRLTLGLTERQAKAVDNFRRLLEEGDPGALQRVLRDQRFDGTVQRGIDGEFIDADKIDRMVERYAERTLAHRARTIAFTESIRAANEGRRAAWFQYVDRTRMDPAGVVRYWQTAGDERVCIICWTIPFMNPDGVPLDGDYQTPEGTTDGPPEHTSCRCTERFGFRRAGLQRPAFAAG